MPLSEAQYRAVLGRSSDDGALILVTIETAQATLRLARNPADVVSNGNTYQKMPFDIALAGDGEQTPTIAARLGNTDRRIMAAIEAEFAPPRFTIQAVLVSNPDEVFKEYSHFKLRDTRADLMWIEGTLGQDRIASEPWPKVRATREKFPGLFRR